MISNTPPTTLFVPAVYFFSIAKITITTMDNNLIDLSHLDEMLAQKRQALCGICKDGNVPRVYKMKELI